MNLLKKNINNVGLISSLYLVIRRNKVSYPNFVRGPYFVGMRSSFDHFKMFNTHCHGIRKVLGRFGKKTTKNTKAMVNLSNTGGAFKKLHLEHSGRWGELINWGCAQKT